jgi:hypothetical protein
MKLTQALAPGGPGLVALHPAQTRVLEAVRAFSLRRMRMDEDKFNMSLRKFLKHVGVTSQREIERVVREGNLQSGKLKVKMVLTAPGTDLNHVVEQDIDVG